MRRQPVPRASEVKRSVEMGEVDDSATGDKHNPNAARDHLANERTFLAWVRSCIAVVGLGFVIARFGLVLRELGSPARGTVSHGTSTAFGIALVLCGAVLTVLAALRYRAAGLAIGRNDYRPSLLLILVLTGGFVVVAVLLAVYLLATASP